MHLTRPQGDPRLPREVQQPSLAGDLQLGAGDLLLVVGDGSSEHAEDLLRGGGEPLRDEQPQHLDLGHVRGGQTAENEEKLARLFTRCTSGLSFCACSVSFSLTSVWFDVSTCCLLLDWRPHAR